MGSSCVNTGFPLDDTCHYSCSSGMQDTPLGQAATHTSTLVMQQNHTQGSLADHVTIGQSGEQKTVYAVYTLYLLLLI